MTIRPAAPPAPELAAPSPPGRARRAGPRAPALLALALALTAPLGGCGGGSPAGDPCGLHSPGAQWLAFSSKRTGNYDLFLLRMDGTCLRPLTTAPGDDLFASWSPQGEIAFMRIGGSPARMQLHAVDAGSGAERDIGTGALAATSPAFSRDGSRVAFEGYQPGVAGTSDLYWVPAVGGAPTTLTTGGGFNAGPAWSADGRTLYFVSNRTGRYDVWSVGADGGPETQVTRGSGILGRPALSPDGRSLAYARPSATAFSEVVILDLATSTLDAPVIRLVSADHDDEPAFCRSGRHLAVTSSRSGNKELWLLDAAATPTQVPLQLTSDASIDGAAAFGPFP